jgi:hypothetical protein
MPTMVKHILYFALLGLSCSATAFQLQRSCYLTPNRAVSIHPVSSLSRPSRPLFSTAEDSEADNKSVESIKYLEKENLSDLYMIGKYSFAAIGCLIML